MSVVELDYVCGVCGWKGDPVPAELAECPTCQAALLPEDRIIFMARTGRMAEAQVGRREPSASCAYCGAGPEDGVELVRGGGAGYLWCRLEGFCWQRVCAAAGAGGRDGWDWAVRAELKATG